MIEIINSPKLESWDGEWWVRAGERVILTVPAETLAGANPSRQKPD